MKKYSKKFTQGFTLIELLVVIAIIGILSSVVLASLSTARTKGADAAAKAGLAQLRTQGSLYYDSNSSSYGSGGSSIACSSVASTTASVFASSTVIIANVNANSNGAWCYSDASNWYAVVALKGGGSYCVDDKGGAKTYTGATSTATLTAGCI